MSYLCRKYFINHNSLYDIQCIPYGPVSSHLLHNGNIYYHEHDVSVSYIGITLHDETTYITTYQQTAKLAF